MFLTNEYNKMVYISDKRKRKIQGMVILILRRTSRPMSTNEVAETMGRSWQYTNDLLNILSKEKKIKSYKRGRTKFWMT